jgi:hypothetical protein
MGFLFDDGGGSNIAPKDIIDVGYVLTPGEDYQYVGGGGAINIPYFPSTTTPTYVPTTRPVSQSPTKTPTNGNKSGETWVYVVMIAMMMIMVIVLAVVL